MYVHVHCSENEDILYSSELIKSNRQPEPKRHQALISYHLSNGILL